MRCNPPHNFDTLSPSHNMGGGGYCMKGNITTREKCPVCGGKMVNDANRNGCFCPDHPNIPATKDFRVLFGRNIDKRFIRYDQAQRFLTGLRFKTDEGSFDSRDYQSKNPLGFSNLAEKYVKLKEQTVEKKTFQQIEREMRLASEHWKGISVKEIHYADLEDYLMSKKISAKSRANYCSILSDFYKWLLKRRVIKLSDMPEFPSIKFNLKFKKTVGKETQLQILDEIYAQTWDKNPRIWMGIKFMCTYISIRPNEMRNLKEEHIDRENLYFIIPDPKEKKPKVVPVLQEDIDLIDLLPKGLPHLFFFRHEKGHGQTKAGEQFGVKLFYKTWMKACKTLGIEGVDLYRGTRHSSAIALRKFHSPEQIKKATMHSTNKAFERYFQIGSDDIRDIYKGHDKARHAHDKKKRAGGHKVLKLKK